MTSEGRVPTCCDSPLWRPWRGGTVCRSCDQEVAEDGAAGRVTTPRVVRLDFGPATLRFRLWFAWMVVLGRAVGVDGTVSQGVPDA